MTRTRRATLAAFVVLSMVASGCSPAADAPGNTSGGAPNGASQPGTSTGSVTIDFRSDPDPPKSGDNAIEVTVRQPDGTAVADASVTAVFSMPAMPAMNMPAMREETKLTHIDGGLYRGTGQLSMAGTWNVTVTAVRDGEPVGRRSFSLVAK